QPLLETGRIKIYSVDSIAGAAWFNKQGTPQHRMWLQNQFHQYVKNEVVPAIRLDCKSPDVGIWAAGSSIGAFHAAAVVCRFPDRVDSWGPDWHHDWITWRAMLPKYLDEWTR